MPGPPINYTTSIDAVKTAGEISALLAKYGASRIAVDYKNGRPSGLAFQINTPQSGIKTYDLPVDVEAMHAVMKRYAPPKLRSHDQAERVAWRVVKVWIQAQLAMLDTQMVSIDELMLPWMHTELGGRTVLDIYRENSTFREIEA